MPLYGAGIDVSLKDDQTPVTVADRRAELAMRDFLERECPDHGLLGEEFGETPGDGRHRWILDPIDGTKSFIHGVPLFGTLVALEIEGEPVVGVIACHAVGETVYGARGHGAFVNGEPARVSTTARLSAATVLSTTVAGLVNEHGQALAALSGQAGLLRTWGDCYGYLLVATGRADVMLDPTMNLWDLAALVPVITEAGGRITEWSGKPMPRISSVASNGILHEAVLTLLGEHR